MDQKPQAVWSKNSLNKEEKEVPPRTGLIGSTLAIEVNLLSQKRDLGYYIYYNSNKKGDISKNCFEPWKDVLKN